MTTGTEPDHQTLQLLNGDVVVAAELDESKTLDSYAPADGMTLHVVDINPSSLGADGGLDDVSQVEKFTLSEEKYEARDDSFRKFRAQVGGGQGRASRGTADVSDDFQKAEADAFSTGARCRLIKSGAAGTVRFVGKIAELKPGWWLGVELDEAVGRNDGAVRDGPRLFECAASHGSFVRPAAAAVLEVADDTPVTDEATSASDAATAPVDSAANVAATAEGGADSGGATGDGDDEL